MCGLACVTACVCCICRSASDSCWHPCPPLPLPVCVLSLLLSLLLQVHLPLLQQCTGLQHLAAAAQQTDAGRLPAGCWLCSSVKCATHERTAAGCGGVLAPSRAACGCGCGVPGCLGGLHSVGREGHDAAAAAATETRRATGGRQQQQQQQRGLSVTESVHVCPLGWGQGVWSFVQGLGFAKRTHTTPEVAAIEFDSSTPCLAVACQDNRRQHALPWADPSLGSKGKRLCLLAQPHPTHGPRNSSQLLSHPQPSHLLILSLTAHTHTQAQAHTLTSRP